MSSPISIPYFNRKILLFITAFGAFCFAPMLPAQEWESLPPQQVFRHALSSDSNLNLRIFPAPVETNETTILIREGGVAKARLHLKPSDLTVKFSEAAAANATGIDGKVINEATGGRGAVLVSDDLTLSDGRLLLEAITLNESGRKDRVIFPRHPFGIRPDPANWANRRSGRYQAADRAEIEARWNRAPSISQDGIALRLNRSDAEVRVWIEDRLVLRLKAPGEVEVEVKTPDGKETKWSEAPLIAQSSETLEPIPLSGYLYEGIDPEVEIEIAPAQQAEVKKLFSHALEGRAIDLGRTRWMQDDAFPLISRDNYAPFYFARSAFNHAAPDAVILTVPNQDYRSVRLLCAPVPGREPTFSVRLSHFAEHTGDGGGVGDALVDHTVVLRKDGGKWPKGCQEVGTLRLADGTTAPLLMVDVPVTTGPIPDLIDAAEVRGRRSTQYLDLELVKALEPVMPYNRGIHAMLPVGVPSGVQVLGVTMERAPRVRLKARQVGSVYLPGEKSGWDLEFDNAKEGFSGKLEWVRRVVDGSEEAESRAVALPEGKKRGSFPLDFDLENGWHEFDFRLLDEEGRLVWERRASLVKLAADTREAGDESPYGIWWFRRVHAGAEGADDIAIIGPLLERMGVRHVCPRLNDPKPSAAEMAPYKVSLSMLPTIKGRTPERFEKSVGQMKSLIAAHPKTEWGLIFHEDSIPKSQHEFPPEFIGREPTPLNEEQKADLAAKLESAVEMGRIVRELRPGLKLIAGNGSLSFAIALMRGGYPKDLADAWGDETVGQSIMPETPPSITINTLFWLREYSRKFGYEGPVTTGFEWTYRSTKPGDLTPLEQAQFYTRDILLAHAYRAPHINPGLIHDVGNAYYYSRWGGTGLMTRFPMLDPKPSYAAYATLTRVLDRTKYERNFPADSPTTNVMEFRRGDSWIYAFWIPRGKRSVGLLFEEGASAITRTDMMGREERLKLESGGVSVELSGSPVYLESSKQLRSVRSEETQIAPPEGQWEVVDTLGDEAAWRFAQQGDQELETYQFDYPRVFVPFQLATAQDPGKGAVQRVSLVPDAERPWPLVCYTILRPKAPIELGGKPEAIGVWAKGNSSWGRIFFELEDAKGRKLLSSGRPEGGWSLNDWQGNQFVNFDGWNFIHVKLPGWYGGSYPMPQNGEWKVSEDGPLVYPVKVTGIVVEMREKVVRINDVVEVPGLDVDLAHLSVLPAQQ